MEPQEPANPLLWKNAAGSLRELQQNEVCGCKPVHKSQKLLLAIGLRFTTESDVYNRIFEGVELFLLVRA